MNAKNTRYILYTAALLAVIAVFYIPALFFPFLASFQLGPVQPFNLLSGAAEVLCILVAVRQVCLPSGIILSFAVPAASYIMTGVVKPLPLAALYAALAAANILLCLTAWLPSLNRAVSAVLAVLLRSGAVFGLVYAMIRFDLVTMFNGFASMFGGRPPYDTAQSMLISGLLGGAAAILITPRLPRARL